MHSSLDLRGRGIALPSFVLFFPEDPSIREAFTSVFQAGRTDKADAVTSLTGDLQQIN